MDIVKEFSVSVSRIVRNISDKIISVLKQTQQRHQTFSRCMNVRIINIEVPANIFKFGTFYVFNSAACGKKPLAGTAERVSSLNDRLTVKDKIACKIGIIIFVFTHMFKSAPAVFYISDKSRTAPAVFGNISIIKHLYFCSSQHDSSLLSVCLIIVYHKQTCKFNIYIKEILCYTVISFLRKGRQQWNMILPPADYAPENAAQTEQRERASAEEQRN